MTIPGNLQEELFFSIIVPAHHEEGYVDKTIRSLKELDYPREKLEVIIVENGSKDKTDEIIRTLSPNWFEILSCPDKGVSKAKNVGIDALSAKSDWVIFLDADTCLEKDFLQEFNVYLHTHAGQNLGCGMVSLQPDPKTRVALGWYRFYNFANRVVRTTRSIQLIRRDLLTDIRFDEALTFDEDTFLLKACMTRSKYFFLKTNGVSSSIRRFEANGWIRQLVQWISYALRTYEQKKRIQYEVLR